MKRNLPIFAVITVVVFTACTNVKKSSNPFFSEFSTPFQVPPFDQIDTTQYLPAFIEGIKVHDQEVAVKAHRIHNPLSENERFIIKQIFRNIGCFEYKLLNLVFNLL